MFPLASKMHVLELCVHACMMGLMGLYMFPFFWSTRRYACMIAFWTSESPLRWHIIIFSTKRRGKNANRDHTPVEWRFRFVCCWVNTTIKRDIRVWSSSWLSAYIIIYVGLLQSVSFSLVYFLFQAAFEVVDILMQGRYMGLVFFPISFVFFKTLTTLLADLHYAPWECDAFN